jgi:hypothetical protein
MLRTNFLYLIFSLLILNSSYAQKGNLIPLDSSNYIFVGDTLFDEYSDLNKRRNYSDTNWTYKNEIEKMKKCPCQTENGIGIITFKSYTNLISENKCFYIYKTNNEYQIKIGYMTTDRDSFGECYWQFHKVKIIEKDVSELITLIKNEIAKSEVPRYKKMKDKYSVVVFDGTNYVFGDIEKDKFSISPYYYYSESVKLIIKMSDDLIYDIFDKIEENRRKPAQNSWR